MDTNDLILGISTSHNSGSALIDLNGNIISSISEERLSRHKNELGIPRLSIREVILGVNLKRIKYVAVGSKYFGMTKKQLPVFLLNYEQKTKVFKNPFLLFKYFLWGLKEPKKVTNDHFKQSIFRRFLEEEDIDIDFDNKLTFINHHVAHAASAFYTCGYEKSLVVTIDAFGDDKSATICLANNNNIELKVPIFMDASLGHMYTFITTALGWVSGRHEGKVTGLAAFGDPHVLGDKLGEYVYLKKQKSNLYIEDKLIKERNKVALKNTYRWVWAYIKWFFSNKDFEYLTREVNRTISQLTFKKIFGMSYKKEDIAAGVQYILEDRVTKFIDFYLKKYNCKNLVLAGGVFANVKLNQRLFNLPQVENIYIHPGMGDEGLALGAAYQVLSKINPNFKRKVIQTVSLGPGYSSDEIKVVLDKEGIKYCQLEDVNKLAQLTAKYISEGKIIGFFNGRMEYGSRALGSRSVLADPRKKEMHSILNDRMKRTEFMPFAPVIPYELTYDILEGKIKGSEHAAEFMTITYDVKKEWQAKIPAVVHVDGTARPQLIKRENNSLYYDIVTEFGKITGVPVIINTSFNMHEEPIVCTPLDAIRSYKEGCVDIMVMENIVVGEE